MPGVLVMIDSVFSLKYVIYPERQHVLEARMVAGDTQEQAAERLLISSRTWARYEAGNCGMPAAYWELYLLKTNQLKEPRK